jgi:FKBP12-rapamycin complex-associated protein
MHFQEDQ